MRRELATSVAIVKDLVRGETCRVVFCILVFFRGCYHGCVARLAGLDGFACGAHRNEKVGEGREILISRSPRGELIRRDFIKFES